MKIFKEIVCNKFLLFMYLAMPILIVVFMYSTLRESIIHNLPIGIVDLDNSTLSHDIAFNIDASPTLEIVNQYDSIANAKDDLNTKKIYALVVIPYNLQKNVKTNNTPEIAVYYNTQLVLIGKNINNTLLQISSNINTKLKFTKNIINDKNNLIAMGESIDFIPKIFGLYNKNSNYMQFLLTAILPCLWQLLIVFCMISLIAKDDTKIKWQKESETYLEIAIKFMFNTIIFFLWWVIMSVFFYQLGFPSGGNINVLAINALVLIIAYNCIGIFIYGMIFSQTRAISIATVYAAPSLAFVGITYPINNMDEFAVFWGSILPITRYLQVYIQQANYEVDAITSLKLVAENLIFISFGILGIIIYYKKLKNEYKKSY